MGTGSALFRALDPQADYCAAVVEDNEFSLGFHTSRGFEHTARFADGSGTTREILTRRGGFDG